MPNLFELQSVPLTSDTAVRDIYFQYSGAEKPVTISEDRRAAQLPRGYGLNLNTYFGSFYEDYWTQYAPVADTFFCFRLKGTISVRLTRYSPDTGDVMLHDLILSGEDEFHALPVPKPGPTPPRRGRIFAHFWAHSEGVVLSDISWRTTTPPRRAVNLEISICTMKRDEALATQLGELFYLQQEKLVQTITLINHDTLGLRQRLEALLPAHAKAIELNIVDQENSGSAGGGARGMIEALDRGTCNYLLRLDDDIRIDHDVMRRLPLLLGYLKDHVAIGAYLFSAMSPKQNYNAGSRLCPDTFFVIPSRFNEDVISTPALNQYAQVEYCDYTCWWCTAFSIEDIQKAGLPAPVFLQFDDVEYSCKLSEAGVENLNWPGIAIWHEPLHFRLNAYKKYYLFRNLLFMMEHYRLLDKRVALRELRGMFTRNLLQYYYSHAFALVRAMEDFLEGPSVLGNWSVESNAKIFAAVKEWEEPDMPRSPPITLMKAKGKAPPYRWMDGPVALLRLLSDLVRPVDAKAPLRSIDYWNGWNIWAAAGRDRIAVTHDRLDVYHVYRRDPRRLLELLRRFAKAYWRIMFSDVSKRDRGPMKYLATQEYWRKKFGKPAP